MRKASYPERTCRVMVPGEFQNHSCEVVEYHRGPCATESVPRSVEIRDAWEKAHQGETEIEAPPEWV